MQTLPSSKPLSSPISSIHAKVSDVELARGLQAGSAWAIAETWHRFAPMVIVTARRALGSESDAEDLAQEVFHRLFRRAKTLRDPDRLRSFVFSFVVRVLKSELRRKARSWLSFREPQTFVDLGGEAVDMESRDLLRRFYALLARLGAKDRLVFALRHLESMTVDEVAATMNLSSSTVKRSLARSTLKMSRWIETDLGLIDLLGGKGWNR
jgi:RNA polymerase sigma-70 factor (ECF subfamily)